MVNGSSRLLAFAIIFISVLLKENAGFLKLTRANCTSLDPDFSRFDLCRLKAVRRNVVEFSFILRLLQVPVRDCYVHGQLFYKANRYLPFLFNTTLDACDFYHNRQRYKYAKIFYDLFAEYTNLNHSCPYEHDIYMTKFTPPDFPLPLPNGEYLVKTAWTVGGKVRLTVNFGFLSQQKDLKLS